MEKEIKDKIMNKVKENQAKREGFKSWKISGCYTAKMIEEAIDLTEEYIKNAK